MAASDDWTVVDRGSRKSKRAGSRTAASAAATIAKVSTDRSTAEPTRAPTVKEQLPGWGADPGRYDDQRTTAPRRRGTRQQQTDAERVAFHEAGVRQYMSELRNHNVWKATREAIATACDAIARDSSNHNCGHVASQPSGPAGGCSAAGIQEMVVYGLGSFEDSAVSRYQLALACLAAECLPGLLRPPQCYDPAFTAVDAALLKRLGMQVIDRDEQFRRPVGCGTLFYLPHCEGHLCDNLLTANWTQAQLTQMLVIGNSFGAYHDWWTATITTHRNWSRPEAMLALTGAGAVTELTIPDHNFHAVSAFNNMSVHTFSRTGLQALGVPE